MTHGQATAAAADMAAVRALETRRCDLISQGDIDALDRLLTDDYLHVHATGRIEDKAAVLRSFAAVARRCSRGELAVRIMGDIAVAVGPQLNVTPREGEAPQETALTVTTVLRREPDGWRFVSFHACRRP